MNIEAIMEALYKIHDELHSHDESVSRNFADSIGLSDREIPDAEVIENFIKLFKS